MTKLRKNVYILQTVACWVVWNYVRHHDLQIWFKEKLATLQITNCPSDGRSAPHKTHFFG